MVLLSRRDVDNPPERVVVVCPVVRVLAASFELLRSVCNVTRNVSATLSNPKVTVVIAVVWVFIRIERVNKLVMVVTASEITDKLCEVVNEATRSEMASIELDRDNDKLTPNSAEVMALTTFSNAMIYCNVNSVSVSASTSAVKDFNSSNVIVVSVVASTCMPAARNTPAAKSVDDNASEVNPSAYI